MLAAAEIGLGRNREGRDALRPFLSGALAALKEVAAATRDLPALVAQLEEEMRTAFLEYSYSVIYSRALPDARDGLKPVQRRILYTMGDMGVRPDRPHVKSARVVGQVMGQLHTHGDAAIYDALVRTAQPWAMRLHLVDGHGNFGSRDGDEAAAYRYTEARLTRFAEILLAELDQDRKRRADIDQLFAALKDGDAFDAARFARVIGRLQRP